MNEDGKKILKAVQQIRKIFKDVSKLLLTADDLMKREEWLRDGPVVYAYGSKDVEKPEQWIPSELFSFYKNKSSPHYLAFVSILLDDDIEGEYTIEEPLITAGFFDYGDKKVTDNWRYWYSRWYGYMENSKEYGKPIMITEKELVEWENEYIFFKSAKCFGLPLISITNPSDIETKIIVPLIDMLID